ncbi:E3 ubiquitin-protein ligase RNF146 isoform X2 [Dermacentor albipictus]|uniref:E3 ubiquitin-protein ligase RNF146 isoform X2 n=1 Tax=Dermacentor albipictus TaxID=60249 RepID=UPI0031FD3F38
MGERREPTETSPASENADAEEELTTPRLECAICLQKCIHPARLPCGHIFCFLCVKGIANQSKRCAMCRQEIPADFTEKPELIPDPEAEQDSPTEESYRWFYEGRNGWWQYDERTSAELEAAAAKQLSRCEVLIAGFLYIVDFEHMVQVRRNDFSRRRRVKRDLAGVPKKGIAGIRLEEPPHDTTVGGVQPHTRECNATEHSSPSDSGSAAEGASTAENADHRASDSTVEQDAMLLNSSNGGGDSIVSLSEEDTSADAFLEGTSIGSLRLDDDDDGDGRGSGDASSPSLYRLSRFGRRRYYEDNL